MTDTITKIDIDLNYLMEIIPKIKNDVDNQHNTGKNYAMIYEELSNKYPEFENRFPMLFKQILDKKSLEMIAYYVVYIDAINKGEITQEEAELEIGKYLQKKFFSHIK